MRQTGFKRRSGLAAAAAALVLAACGGGGGSGGDSDQASIRLVNATSSKASLSLLADSDTIVSATALDTASGYVDIDSGSSTLQVNDATTGTAVTTLTPNLNTSDHYALVAYETSGTVRTTIIAEEASEPSTGSAVMRVVDAAPEAGAVDVYVTAPAVDITTSVSPTFSFGAGTTVQESSFVSLAPGTYRIRVTGAGNASDLRLDIASVTVGNQKVLNFFVTPTAGGTLVNGTVLEQQGALTAGRNTSARVRLAAATTPGATVSASVGTTVLATNVTSPGVSTYVLVPAGGAVSASVNGTALAAPTGTLVAGSDATLLVYGNAGSATASLITDDNRLPSSSSSLRMRLVNGLVGAAQPLSLSADFAVVASNVAPGAASSYTTVPTNTSIRLELTTPTSSLHVDNIASNLGNSVFTYFVLGDASNPTYILRRDR